MFLTEDKNKVEVFTEADITNMYKTLNECNEEYTRLAIKMCKYEHQAILNEDSTLLEEAKEGFGAKVKGLIEELWVKFRSLLTKFKNWFREIIIRSKANKGASLINQQLLERMREKGSIEVEGVTQDEFTKYIIVTSLEDAIASNEDDKKTEENINSAEAAKSESDNNSDSKLVMNAGKLQKINVFFTRLPAGFKAISTAELNAKKAYIRSKSDSDKTALTEAISKSTKGFRFAKDAIKLAFSIVHKTKAALNKSDKDSKKKNKEESAAE